MRGAGPVEMCPRLASQVEEMLEAGRRDERGSRTLALEQRVRRDGRPVREPLDLGDTGRVGSGDDGLLLPRGGQHLRDRKSTRLNSSHVKISYAVFCLKKKKKV